MAGAISFSFVLLPPAAGEQRGGAGGALLYYYMYFELEAIQGRITSEKEPASWAP